MQQTRRLDVVGKDYPRTDGIARVTGAERYTVDGNSCGVACSSARQARIPVNEEVYLARA